MRAQSTSPSFHHGSFFRDWRRAGLLCRQLHACTDVDACTGRLDGPSGAIRRLFRLRCACDPQQRVLPSWDSKQPLLVRTRDNRQSGAYRGPYCGLAPIKQDGRLVRLWPPCPSEQGGAWFLHPQALRIQLRSDAHAWGAMPGMNAAGFASNVVRGPRRRCGGRAV